MKAEISAYWDRMPCNIGHAQAPEGSREFFDQIEAKRYRVESHIPAVARFTELKGKDVLEIGCGLGTDGLQIARAGARYHAVDLSPRSVELCRRRLELYGYEGDVLCHDAESLPFADGSFDHVYSFGVIHHTPRPERVVAEIGRVLRPGGTFVVMLYSKVSHRVLWEICLKEGVLRGGFRRRDFRGLVNAFTEAQQDSPLTRVYTFREARALMESGGALRVTSISKHFVYRYEPAAYRRGEYVLRPAARVCPAPLWALLERLLGWHTVLSGRKVSA